MVWLAKNMT